MTWDEFKKEVERQGVTDEMSMEEIVWYMDEDPVVVFFNHVETGERMFSIE